MKIFAAIIGLFIALGVTGYILVIMQDIDDQKAIKEYMDSRGAAPIPRSWRGKIGEGI
jgi:hypothetical protein